MKSEFRTSLLREKFVLRDPHADKDSDDMIVALSNRIVVPLMSSSGAEFETYVVRTQNMHSCVRLAAGIAKEFFDRGAIMKRTRPFYWQDLWRDVIKGYERDWNHNIWGCIYHNGKLVYSEGEHHPFLDIIEQCDAKNDDKYEDSVAFAESAFKQAGKTVSIEHDANVALVVSASEEQAKCGVIVRSANKTTTFNYTARAYGRLGQKVNIPGILTVSAAFLEAIQLAFTVGMINKKRAYALIEKFSDEDRKGERASQRLANLNRAINQYEEKYEVNYRPDRPIFANMVKEAEAAAMKILEPQIKDMLASGVLDDEEWIT